MSLNRKIIAVSILLAVGLTSLLSGCGRQQTQDEPPPAQQEETERPALGVTIKGSETVQEDETGRPLWRIIAEETRLNEAESRVDVQSGKVMVFAEGSEDVNLNLDFNSLTANAVNRRLHAWGGINADNRETGTSFRADTITVDLIANSVQAKGGIRGENPDGSFEAELLETDLNFSRVRLSSPTGVKGIIGLKTTGN